jgi:voltage-gated sodium channel
MTPSAKLRQSRLANFLISEPVVITLIFVNTMVLFLDEFPEIHQSTRGVLLWIDYGCVIYFLLEAFLKIRIFGFRRYWFSAWNRFDFTVRLFRFFRVFRFIPNAGNIFAGLRRSLRASVGVFAGLFILNFALAMGATMLFGDTAPEHFGTPLKSSYSLFKVFTVEGWYDIPDDLAKGGFSDLMIGLIRVYFIVSVLVGGILGLSLANAVFVDEMTADNTVKVERMVAEMHKEY